MSPEAVSIRAASWDMKDYPKRYKNSMANTNSILRHIYMLFKTPYLRFYEKVYFVFTVHLAMFSFLQLHRSSIKVKPKGI